MNENQLQEALAAGAAQLGVGLRSDQIRKLSDFIQLLEKWNRSFNLTGTKSVSELVHAHVLDSLSIQDLLPAGDVLDVGTGAGFPGIPLAILDPARRFVLLDSNGKKTRFLQQAKTELGLENVMIAHARVEQYTSAEPFSCVLSRAVASVQELGSAILPLLETSGTLLLMKGSEYPEELQNIPTGLVLDEVKTIVVPGKELPRHVLIFRRLIAPDSEAQV